MFELILRTAVPVVPGPMGAQLICHRPQMAGPGTTGVGMHVFALATITFLVGGLNPPCLQTVSEILKETRSMCPDCLIRAR